VVRAVVCLAGVVVVVMGVLWAAAGEGEGNQVVAEVELMGALEEGRGALVVGRGKEVEGAGVGVGVVGVEGGLAVWEVMVAVMGV
jgi:hypothetical protein